MKEMGTEYTCYLGIAHKLPRRNGLIEQMLRLQKTFKGEPFTVWLCDDCARECANKPGEEIV